MEDQIMEKYRKYKKVRELYCVDDCIMLIVFELCLN